MDLQRKQFSLEIGGRTLKLEVSKLAEQANFSVLGSYGKTTVLATAVMAKKDNDVDYLPLTVNYEEKFYAGGRILGSRFLRRENRPSDEAILSGRLIDRALRPLFNQKIRREIQVVITVLSYDGENDPDFLGLVAASTALAASDIPWNGPIAGVRLLKLKDKDGFVLNPTNEELKSENTEFDTFVAGVNGKINMIELGGSDAPEKNVASAFKEALAPIAKLIDFQNDVVKSVGVPKTEVAVVEPDEKLKKEVAEFLKGKLEDAVYPVDANGTSVKEKQERGLKMEELRSALLNNLASLEFDGKSLKQASALFDEEVDVLVHRKLLNEGIRPDGRAYNELRELYAEVGVLPVVHGSALFVRGNTQALAVTTLAAPGAEKLGETLDGEKKERFFLHYNFPPFSTGETGGFRGPGRREIGHGALAEKAVTPLIPKKEEFPYVIRVVSEILSSNGSSSMATVCASVMSLMEAGVPVKKPAAGIAMGLMSDETGKYKVLTDIQGPEDHHGDMDFKVAGTEDGINALQMDVKISGVSVEVLEEAMAQSREARLKILETMKKAIPAPRTETKPGVPQIVTLSIDPLRIGEVIGAGGKVINGIIEKTGALSIDIDDDGEVFISADNRESAEKAADTIRNMLREFEIGEIVEGTVDKILEFGAIVDLGGGKSGMIHVSELKNGYVEKVTDVLKLGDHVRAKVIKLENGKVGLSVKQLDS
ncbi:MAG: polyribonucleotide nucleotidyltransferase [Patescibacteria group bacterium]|nr:polyribonucleotide nucleotidyltransferase [Patescibacteria group bacterium]